MRFPRERFTVARLAALGAAFALGAMACSSPDPNPVSSGATDPVVVGLRGDAPVLLQGDRSCDAVLEDFQAFAPAVLQASFGLDEDTATVAPQPGTFATGDAAVAEAAAPVAADANGSGGGTSHTNTHEAGIDEPDVVETDGDFVYLVDEDRLVILDGATAEVLSRTPLAGRGAQLLLSGDRLLAITGGGGWGISRPGTAVEDVAVEPAPEPRPTEPPSFVAGTVLQLIDVADRRAPAIVQTTEIEGQHVSTRVVDGVARVVVTSHPQPQPLLDMPVSSGDGPGDVQASLQERIATTVIEDWLPAFRTTAADGATAVEGTLVECEDVLVPEVNAGVAETSVLRVDFTDGFDPADTTTIVAQAGTVYSSATTLYVAATRYVSPAAQGGVVAEDRATAVHAFELRGAGPAVHLGGGEVPGTLVDQYALSEHDGHLRIATTEGTPWDEGDVSESFVRVLRLDAGRLVEVGAVGGLGRTETIQSVRFLGPVGYVVTFRQTDPLYVIDLSVPTAPRAVGELKIPGFSSYLHPVGEGRLLGIGRDADLEGRDQGFLVSLFDVSDPAAPTQLQTYTERDAWSAAGSDPTALLWWAPESAAILPIERHVTPTAERPDGFEAGITVLDVSDEGIVERATVSLDGRHPHRAVVVQDRLWSLFDGAVVTSGFDAPAEGTLHPLR
jgi:hypothetical protein